MRTIPVLNSLLRIAYAAKDDDDLTPLRVQKLLYLVHGWYMAIVGESLFDEAFVAGRYGPELLSLHTSLAKYCGVPVDDYIQEFDVDSCELGNFLVNEERYPQFGTIAKRVFDTHRHLTTAQLSTLCHADGSAWARTAQGQPLDNAQIREDFIRIAWNNEHQSKSA
jgi:uncharacterized phage-associated protein